MISAVPSFKPSPETCLKCGHAFVPGSPEPCWCPDCGKLCSAFDVDEQQEAPEPEPVECQETPEQRQAWWRWFWLMLAAGPLAALVIGLTSPQLVKLAPVWMKDMVKLSTSEAGMGGAILCGALGAIFCVGRLRRGQDQGESRTVLTLVGMILMFAYLVLCTMMVMNLLRAIQGG